MDKLGGGVSLVSVLFVCLILPKKFIENSSVFQKSSGREKIPCMKEGCITFFRRNFSVPQSRKSSLGTPACFRKIMSATTFFGSEVRAHITFYRRNSFVSHYRKISLRTLRCFRKILTVKTCYGCEGGHHALPSKFHCLTLPKTFLGTLRCFKKDLAAEGLYGWEKEVSCFSVEKILYHSTEIFQWDVFGVS